jgi:hypothetical protein
MQALRPLNVTSLTEMCAVADLLGVHGSAGAELRM